MFDGWWHGVLRIGPDTFALRDEAPPQDATFLEDVATRLGAAGLSEVPADPTLITVITYTTLDLGGVDWQVWSTDLATAEAELTFKASQGAFFGDVAPLRADQPRSFVAVMGGLRRTAGLAPLVVVAVGIDGSAVGALAGGLGNCHVESRTFDDLEPEACHALTPNLLLVDASGIQGEEFIRRFRDSSDRLVPVVAVSAGFPEGADTTIDPGSDPAEWGEHLQNMLP